MDSSPSLALVVGAAAVFGSWPAPRLELEPLSCRCECQVHGRDIEVYLLLGIVVSVSLLFFCLGWCARGCLGSHEGYPTKGSGKRNVYSLAALPSMQ